MFGWLKKKSAKQTAPEPFADGASRVISVYGSILNSYSHHIIDASWLPAPKESMIQIFKLLIAGGQKFENETHRDRIESYWSMLSRFQPGVGSIPIDVEISKDNPTVAVWRERAARLEKWLEIANAEAEKYEREIERLRQR